jgi:hypothetical protein
MNRVRTRTPGPTTLLPKLSFRGVRDNAPQAAPRATCGFGRSPNGIRTRAATVRERSGTADGTTDLLGLAVTALTSISDET